MRRIDYYSGGLVGRGCDSAVELALPDEVRLPRGGCEGRGFAERTLDWLQDVFN